MRNAYRLLPAFLLPAAFAFAPAAALGQAAYLLAGGNQLVRIDASAPGTIRRSVTVTGLLGDSLLAIDFRPVTGQLFGLGSGSRLYTINTYTGAATQVGSGVSFSLSGAAFGFDVNPVPDRIRVVSATEQNLRLNPDTGAISGVDVALAYAIGDPNAGADPNVVGSAYTNNFAGATTTTLYGIDTSLGILVVQNPPNNGTLNTVGPLGFAASGMVGFDIRTVGAVNTAYAALRVGGVDSLFTVNLATGGATQVGSLPVGLAITGLAMAPSPFKPAFDLNRDSRSDILYRNVATGWVWRMLMNGFASMGGTLVHYEPDTAWKIVADADFDGDGRGDLLWRHAVSGKVYLATFNEEGLVSTWSHIYTESDANWEIVQTPDLNGDGRADLVWYHGVTGKVWGMLFNGAGFIGQGMVHVQPDTDWSIVASAGVAGRGRQNQLVWRNSSTGEVYMMAVAWTGAGFTQSGSVIYAEPDTQWRIVGAPDLDGDGQSDLLWRNAATGQVYGMLLDGGVIAARGMVHVEPDTAWKIVAFGDYNGDGKADLLWRNEANGRLYMMLMNGLAIADQASVYTEGDLNWKVMGPYEYAQQ